MGRGELLAYLDRPGAATCHACWSGAGHRWAGCHSRLANAKSAHPIAWFSTYHHQLHNLAFGLAVAGVSFALARHRWMTGLLALLSFHLHLLEDVLGARGPDGYQWPIPYLTPFSETIEFTWQGQWALNACRIS